VEGVKERAEKRGKKVKKVIADAFNTLGRKG